MKLYHGSNIEVREPKILQSNRALDFGTAFYMTSDYEQAKKWAKLTADRKRSGTPVISEFEFDDERIGELEVIRYESADRDWLGFVSGCRSEKNHTDKYDIIIGPVANDRTFDVISLYLAGIYDEDEAIRRLLPFKLKDQYAFKSEKALGLLIFKRGILV
ncbi:MAG: DUF3990 domain-containing protein [Ruminococcus sp.]|nr:DUF3990 domain-containing protein [Ruminococcus sp.]